MPLVSTTMFAGSGKTADADEVTLTDDENNPIVWDETSDSGGILID